MATKQIPSLVLQHGDVGQWIIHRERTNYAPESTWHHCPEPMPGEILSSYFTRAAKANFAEPIRSLQVIDPCYKPRDLDFALREDLLQNIARRLKRDVWELKDMNISSHSRNDVILGGARYCPFCLEEDGKNTYFRYAWRLNFITVCTKHACYLEDKCPHCGSSVHYWETRFDQTITDCCTCGGSLLTATHHIRSIGPECRHVPLFFTFQETLLAVFRTEDWKGGVIGRVKFFNKFWRLAWAVRRFDAQREKCTIEIGDTWQTFKRDLISSTEKSFKAIFRTFAVLEEFPERLETPWICPVDGKRFSSVVYYTRHMRAHVIFSGTDVLQPVPSEPNTTRQVLGATGYETVIQEISGYISKLSLPQSFQSQVLADIVDFLMGFPTDIISREFTRERTYLLTVGLTWAFGRYYGITYNQLAIILGTEKGKVSNRVESFKVLIRKMGMSLPLAPLPSWAMCILSESHERLRVLSLIELRELAREINNLDFPWKQPCF
ncbi:MAG TPA: TniQ family protein [Candidatus Lokiarchaeia archaeon]|nr:TniQ family protein [Candidatus Lokiarchaeia archaeon]